MTEVPLRLWDQPHWELKGNCDSVRFFQLLSTVFPCATTLFVEGTSIAKDVEEFYRSAGEAGPHLPARQTIWPRPKQFRLRADATTLGRLIELAASHAEPEMLDHLFVYAGSEPLIEFPDAFLPDCPILVSHQASGPQVRCFANELRLEVKEAGTT